MFKEARNKSEYSGFINLVLEKKDNKTIAVKKYYEGFDTDIVFEYIEESLEKYYKKNIISDFIFGIGLLTEFFSNNKVIYYCGYFLAFIGAITIFINTNKLQKKDE